MKRNSSSFASFVIVPHTKFAVKLPDSIPLDMACMFGCSSLTSFHAVKVAKLNIENAIKYKDSAKALIIGAGGLGLWGTQFAKLIFPSQCRLTVADINEKLKVAKYRGCDDVILWNESNSISELISKTTAAGQYDAIIDFVNNSTSANVASMSLSKHGHLVLVGLFGGEMNFSLPMMVLKNHKYEGLLIGSLAMMKELIELAEKQKLVPPPIEYIKLEDIASAFHSMKQGKGKGRFVIDFS